MSKETSPLLTDFYQLTMMGGYFKHHRHAMEVVFEYFFRSLPDEFGFAVFAGLEDFTNRLDNPKRFVTDHQKVVTIGCVAVKSFIDFAIGRVDTDL